MCVSCSQGTRGDIGLPGPQGPMGVGVEGPPVGHKCIFLHNVCMMSCFDIVKRCFLFTF